MSKRWGNVINPDKVVEEFGADTLRMYEMFMGPLEDAKPWSKQGIIGVRRFLEKVYKFISNSQSPTPNLQKTSNSQSPNTEVERLLHKTIKKVTEDIENLHFNTAVSAMMIFVNQMSNVKCQVSSEVLEKFLIILAPFAPYLSEELWSSFAPSSAVELLRRRAKASDDRSSKYNESIFLQRWPEYDKKLVIDEEVTIAVQVNGKLRDTIKVERGIKEDDLRSKIEDLLKVKKHLEGKEIKKFIYIKDKLVNIVV